MNPQSDYPPLPYEAWKDAKTTLHLFCQIVGKLRLGLSPKMNHWWHVPFYVSPRGLTTSTIPHAGLGLEMEFDFFDHVLAVRSSDGMTTLIPLEGISVADLHTSVLEALHKRGLKPRILSRPFDPEKVGSDIPFAQDTQHHHYEQESVARFWHVLVGLEGIFREFRGRYLGKCSPVHFFWHSFDLAVTRFSGRTTEVAPDADPVTREAYSHEVVSHGFWPGDNSMPEAAFYSYTAPEPEGLSKEPLRPAGAWWQDLGTSSMALYKYEDFRNAPDPRVALLDFLQSSYEAGAKRASWPRAELELS